MHMLLTHINVLLTDVDWLAIKMGHCAALTRQHILRMVNDNDIILYWKNKAENVYRMDFRLFQVNRRDENNNILLTQTTAAQKELTLSYHSMRGLYFLAAVFTTIIVMLFSKYQAFEMYTRLNIWYNKLL